jgi:hypothetical protein
MLLAIVAVPDDVARGVSDQRVPEAELAGYVRIALEELRETIPRLRVERSFWVTFQHLHYELSGEAGAEDRSPAARHTVHSGGHAPICRVPKVGRQNTQS